MIGSYRLARRHRGIIYIAGHVSLRLDHSDLIRGKVGADLTLEEAGEAARICALHMLSTLRTLAGPPAANPARPARIRTHAE